MRLTLPGKGIGECFTYLVGQDVSSAATCDEESKSGQ